MQLPQPFLVGLVAVHAVGDDHVNVIKDRGILGGYFHPGVVAGFFGFLRHHVGYPHAHGIVEEAGTRVAGTVKAQLIKAVLRAKRGKQHLFALECGMLRYRGLNLLLQVGGKLLPLGLLAHGGGVHFDHLVHGCSPWFVGVSHRGGDSAQLVVVVLAHAGVGGQNHIRVGVGNLVKRDGVGLLKQLRGFATEFLHLVRHPRQHAGRVTPPRHTLHAHRHHPKRQRHLLVSPRHGRNPLRFFINHGLAERMLNRDRPGGRRCALAALRRLTAARLGFVGRLRTTSEHQAHSGKNGGNP